MAFASFFAGSWILASSPDNAGLHSELYDRTTNTFARACLFKPVESEAADTNFTLAPLILQEVVSPESERHGVFGGLSSQNGDLSINYSSPTVYVKSDTVQVNGVAHVRVAYVWFCIANAIDGARRALSMQGIRITLDSCGRPKIWETLADACSAKLIFVSKAAP